jgi:hypothetical protein
LIFFERRLRSLLGDGDAARGDGPNDLSRTTLRPRVALTDSV